MADALDLGSCVQKTCGFDSHLPHQQIITNKLRKKVKHYNYLNYIYSCYLRFEVKDKPGVLASITKEFAVNKIN